MATKPTIAQPLFPGDRATAPMALEDASDTTWKQFEELLSAKDMGFEPAADAPEGAAPGGTDAAETQLLAPAGGYEATQVLPMGVPTSLPAVGVPARPASSVPAADRKIEVNDVMTLARRNNRACPNPPQWAAFHKLLPMREQDGRRIPAPAPIDGAIWSASSPMQKRLRLRDQIEWADRTGVLMAAYALLAALPEEHWHHF